MNRKQRQHRRAVANGEVHKASRRPAIPSPKVFRMKTDYKRNKKVSLDDYE
ncbi:hypothetical protein SAMN06296952_2127 [Oscillospiraceae bacterium]|nr:hypothetical protein SAMN06296952_2127 [Oscillospiraceae bacterium]